MHTYTASSWIASTVFTAHILGTALHIPGGTAFYFVLNAGPGIPPSICRKKPHSLLSDTALGNAVPARSLHWPSRESGQDMSTAQEKQKKVHT